MGSLILAISVLILALIGYSSITCAGKEDEFPKKPLGQLPPEPPGLAIMWLTGSWSGRELRAFPLMVQALPQASVNKQSLVPSLTEHQRGTKKVGHPAPWTRCLIPTSARGMDGVWTLIRNASQLC